MNYDAVIAELVRKATLAERWMREHATREQGALYLRITTTTGSYTALFSDAVILCDATGGALTVTLPAVASSKSLVLTIKKTDASGNAVTIDTPGAETIDGSATRSLPAQYNSLTIVCDGTNWHRIASI